MKKSSGSLKKYKMAGPVEGKPVIKGVASAIKTASKTASKKAAYDEAAKKFIQNYNPSIDKYRDAPEIGQRIRIAAPHEASHMSSYKKGGSVKSKKKK